MAKGTQRDCLRCGYCWTQRLATRPRRCANTQCRTVYWDVPRRLGTPEPPEQPVREPEPREARS